MIVQACGPGPMPAISTTLMPRSGPVPCPSSILPSSMPSSVMPPIMTQRLSRFVGRPSARGLDLLELEVHRVGVAPVAAPGEAPVLEDRDHLRVHLTDGAALVLPGVDVDGESEGVVGQRRAAGDEAWVVAADVVV